MAAKILTERVRWDITSKCNLACLHCYSSDIELPDLHLSDVIRILEILATNELCELNLSGREPTMRNDLAQIINWCHERDITVNMATNGTRLDNTKLRMLRDLSMIVYSLDGPSPLSHDKIRGEGNFVKTISSIKECLHHRMHQNNNTQIGISCTLQKYNLTEIHLMIGLCTSLGVDFLSINPISFCGSALPRKGMLRLSNDEIAAAWEEVCMYYSKSRPRFELYLGTYPMETKLLNLRYGLDLPIIQDGCSAGKTLYINARGDAYPCYMIVPMAASKSELEIYLRPWKVLTEPVSRAEADFQSFITFTNIHSQHNDPLCTNCSDIATCRRCPLVSLFDTDTIKRCVLARDQLASIKVDFSPSATPKIRDSIQWTMKGNIVRIWSVKCNYNSYKEFILSPIAQEIWRAIHKKFTICKINKILTQKFGQVSQERRLVCLRDCMDYLWKEGIIVWGNYGA